MSRVTKASPTASTLGQSTAGLALSSGTNSQAKVTRNPMTVMKVRVRLMR